MSIYVTDGSFEGLLCAIFASYRAPAPTAIVEAAVYQASLLDENIEVTTEDDIALRVLKGIDAVSDGQAGRLCLKIFLSELDDANLLVYRLIRKLMRVKHADFLKNYADDDVLRAAQIRKMMGREIHRMHAFVRFQKARDGVYYALIDPDFDVVPLLDDHFVRRFADMSWRIFDVRRQYGIAYDGQAVHLIDSLGDIIDPTRAQLDDARLDEQEKAFQGLWKVYFDSVNIKARHNEKHHLRQLPKRYWKYLSEKQPLKPEELMEIDLRSQRGDRTRSKS